MNTPELKTLIKDNKVSFNFYRAGIMYYRITSESVHYQFPVRLDDIGDATLFKEDKAILFMRYIRKAIESNELEILDTTY